MKPTNAIILIVDDVAANRDTLIELLQNPDYHIAQAVDGSEALRLAAESPPDLILLDVMMPGMDGYEVCRRLRADGRLAEVPVIIITTLDDQASRLAGIEAGADDFITKPFHRAELRARVRTITRLNRYRRLLESQAQLQQSQKIAMVGQLAGGIAHDFNNLLTVIIGYSELMITGLDPKDKIYKKLEMIHNTGKRAAALTQQLLAFSRQQILQPTKLNLNVVLSGIDAMLLRLVREDISIVLNPAPTLRIVNADVGQVEQVLVNLVVNARDAMPMGGKISIQTANVDLDTAYERAHPYVKAGSYVKLSVADTGCGMSPAIKARIFEPYFTTKESGKGTGLGLATVFGIVKQSGGHIEVHSEVGVGTTFEIYLPAVPGDADARPVSRQRANLTHGTETILLVEDEEGVRELTREILTECGYTIIKASNGKEALRIVESNKETIHLLLSDIIMPEMHGPQLAEQILSLRPEVKHLFMSGYTDQSVFQHDLLKHGGACIQKPFTPETLAQKVREALGR